VHKWFARRPGTLFRALILSELDEQRIDQTYFHGHNFSDKHILDPFMGGGTTVVEANRLGCMVTAADINPMAWWIVRQEILDLDLAAYRQAADVLRRALEEDIGPLYRTRCLDCGSEEAHVKYFLWVKSPPCQRCGKPVDLFPNYLFSEAVRHPTNVFVCHVCGELYKSESRKVLPACDYCGSELTVKSYSRNQAN
jgi:putative DNA methylase